jgi:hypothetical protein
MIAPPPGDNVDFGEGSAAEAGERSFPGVLAAFRAAYSSAPHAGKALGEGISAYTLEGPPTTVFYARAKNKVAILAVKKAGVTLTKSQLSDLSQLAALLRKGA